MKQALTDRTDVPDEATVRERLDAHFRLWLGAIPAPGEARLVITPLRDEPGWDGKVRPIQGVTGPEGAVLAVSPSLASLSEGVAVEDVFADAAASDGHDRLQARLGVPVSFGLPLFRWSERAAVMEGVGEWVDRNDPRIPDWLRPFNGGILATFDAENRYVAGVGLKRHNHLARELSVMTDPGYRGKGMATRLVAQAARQIIAEGGVPIYQHTPDNEPSARVADSAGFPHRGWYMLEIHPGARGEIRG
jgi:RimJ/RimL family protein N-acetyltransferase